MEELKKLFSYSKDTVIITDRSFNILWSNKDKSVFSEYGKCCGELFRLIPKPVKSGRYEILHSGLVMECNIIVFPDCEDGVYVITTEEEDLLMSFLGKEFIKNFFENQSGATRSAFSGIIMSNNEIKEILEQAKLYNGMEFTDRNAVNSFRMMRFASTINELIRYTDGSIREYKIDLSMMLEKFVQRSEDAFKSMLKNVSGTHIRFEAECDGSMYVSADPDRLENCLISLAMLANGRDRENNIIKISAARSENSISLTFTSERCGTDSGSSTLLKHEYMYSADEYKPELLLVKTFCRRFGCTLYIKDNADEPKSFSIKFPVYNESSPIFMFESDVTKYGTPYTNYHFSYSDLL